MSLLLGIDIGTTNWKAAVFDENGKAICIKKTPAITRYDEKEQGYYDPNELWDKICSVIKSTVEFCGRGNISAVSVTSMAETVVPIDKDGNCCYPFIAWFDTRSIREAEIIEATIGKQKLFEITGLDPNPIFSVPKIMWIRENAADAYEKAYKWLQISDFINFKLTGEFVTDYTLASRTLALDIHKKEWSDTILEAMQISKDTFPELTESGKVIGQVNKKASEVTGLPAGVPVVMGGHDHPCATIPTGTILGRKILDSSGTAEAFLFVSGKGEKAPKVDIGQRVCLHLDPSRYVLWGGIIASGISVDWGFNRFASVEEWGFKKVEYTYAELSEKIATIKPGSDGAMYLPHLRGSGAPYWDPRAKGAYIGLKSTHTNVELMRALFEGLSFQAKMIIEMEESLAGYKVESLCTVGGGTKIKLWQQIKADVTGKVIEIPEVSDATALGAALLAGVGTGVYKSIEEASRTACRSIEVIEPNNRNSAIYSELYGVYCDAYDALKETNYRLDEIFR